MSSKCTRQQLRSAATPQIGFRHVASGVVVCADCGTNCFGADQATVISTQLRSFSCGCASVAGSLCERLSSTSTNDVAPGLLAIRPSQASATKHRLRAELVARRAAIGDDVASILGKIVPFLVTLVGDDSQLKSVLPDTLQTLMVEGEEGCTLIDGEGVVCTHDELISRAHEWLRVQFTRPAWLHRDVARPLSTILEQRNVSSLEFVLLFAAVARECARCSTGIIFMMDGTARYSMCYNYKGNWHCVVEPHLSAASEPVPYSPDHSNSIYIDTETGLVCDCVPSCNVERGFDGTPLYNAINHLNATNSVVKAGAATGVESALLTSYHNRMSSLLNICGSAPHSDDHHELTTVFSALEAVNADIEAETPDNDSNLPLRRGTGEWGRFRIIIVDGLAASGAVDADKVTELRGLLRRLLETWPAYLHGPVWSVVAWATRRGLLYEGDIIDFGIWERGIAALKRQWVEYNGTEHLVLLRTEERESETWASACHAVMSALDAFPTTTLATAAQLMDVCEALLVVPAGGSSVALHLLDRMLEFMGAIFPPGVSAESLWQCYFRALAHVMQHIQCSDKAAVALMTSVGKKLCLCTGVDGDRCLRVRELLRAVVRPAMIAFVLRGGSFDTIAAFGG